MGGQAGELVLYPTSLENVPEPAANGPFRVFFPRLFSLETFSPFNGFYGTDSIERERSFPPGKIGTWLLHTLCGPSYEFLGKEEN